MGQALYRKYRSRSLDEIVGQSHITTILKRAIEANRIAHAYLLTGPKGVGKTSIARILAHEINKLPYSDESSHLDIVEIDAASNNSVEDIRDLRERVQIAPSSAEKKIYIIDEVHMLSKSAFNALLKTLEEPPEHVVFILATTDVDKLPATILSRVQRFNFRAAIPADNAKHLRTIADAEGIAIDDDALSLIAERSDGSFRNSVSLLDQLRHASDDSISREIVEQVLGLADSDIVAQLLNAYADDDLGQIVALVDQTEAYGTPAVILADQLIAALHQRIINQPSLLPLLDRLLEVRRSAWPYIKLLTALTADMSNQPSKSSPNVTAVPAPSHSSTLEELPPVDIAQPAQKETSKSLAKQEPPTSSPSFQWDSFLERVKDKAPGAYSLLGKAGYDLSANTFTLYAGREFNKKQLEKSLPVFAEILEQMKLSDHDIVISPNTKPPKDGQTAAIVAMMGGGEEVSVDG
jgi:DNA polymerase-3 subunit gamma/tau